MSALVLSGCSELETMFAVAEDISTEVPELLQPAVQGPLTEGESIPTLEDRGIILEEVTDEII